MDVFGTVMNAIQLAQQVQHIVQSVRDAPESLERITHEMKTTEMLLKDYKDVLTRHEDKHRSYMLALQPMTATIKALKRLVERCCSGSSRRGAFLVGVRFYFHESELGRLLQDLQDHQQTLGVMCSLTSVTAAIDTYDLLDPDRPGSSIVAQGNERSSKGIDLETFLASLSSRNVTQDFDRIRDASKDTCQWIFETSAYQSWLSDSKSAWLHLCGKMGSGKSVLVKSIFTSLCKLISSPPSPDDETAVIAYVFNSVSRPESASDMVEALIRQFLYRRPQLFESLKDQTQILDTFTGHDANERRREPRLPLDSLWKILLTLFELSSHQTVYCLIDALDECDHESAHALLKLWGSSANRGLLPSKRFKLNFSSRPDGHIIDGLNFIPELRALEINPRDVVLDIQTVLHEEMTSISNGLGLDPSEREGLESSLRDKADGMFQWIITAVNELRNAQDCTYDSLLELTRSLPSGLEQLYENAFSKLCKSLETSPKAADLVRKILVWVLLAVRPLTVAELPMALAMHPDGDKLPTRGSLQKGIRRTVLRYLSPFIEVVAGEDESGSIDRANEPRDDSSVETATASPSATPKPDNSVIQIVHKSAQEFLLKVCTAPGEQSALSFNINDGHEEIAKICIAYQKVCQINHEIVGRTDAKVKVAYDIDESNISELRARLHDHAFLVYAIEYRQHVKKCSDRGPGDAYDAAIEFLVNHRERILFGRQVWLTVNKPDYRRHWLLYSPLFSVVRSASYSLIHRFLDDQTLDVNEGCPPNGRTPLMVVCSWADPGTPAEELKRIAELLLDRGADVAVKDRFGWTCLHAAAHAGKVDLARLVLKKGADLEARNKRGVTPLIEAVSSAQDETAIFLLDSGADILAQDANGKSVLHLVRRKKTPSDLSQTLIARGANVQAIDKDGRTPLLWACRNVWPDAVKLLCEAGADVNAADNNGFTPIIIASGNYKVKVPDDDRIKVLEILLQRGADINACSQTGIRAIHMAAMYSKGASIVNFLSQNKADRHKLANDRRSIVHFAASNPNSVASLQSLLESSIELDTESTCIQEGWTSLHCAVRLGTLDAVRLLLASTKDVQARTQAGSTILHLAAVHKNNTLEYLLDMPEIKPLIDVRNSLGATCLQLAIRRGHIDGVKKLLSMDVQLSGTDKFGRTVAHYAMLGPSIEVLHELLQLGEKLNWDTQDLRGSTPLHIAAALEKTDMMRETAKIHLASRRDANGWYPRDILCHFDLDVKEQLFPKRKRDQTCSCIRMKHPSRFDVEGHPFGKDLIFTENQCCIEVASTAHQPHLSEWPYPSITTRDGFKALRFGYGALHYGITLRTDYCIPGYLDEYYFEVDVLSLKNLEECGFVAIGVGQYYAHIELIPGLHVLGIYVGEWVDTQLEQSWAYCSDDGRYFHDSRQGSLKERTTFSAGDTVGCGVNLKSHELYFTKNGTILGTAFKDVRGQLYPMVGLLSPGTKIRARFGLPPPVRPTSGSSDSSSDSG